jgi:hypothetical protein
MKRKLGIEFFRAQGKLGGKLGGKVGGKRAWKNLSKEERSRIMTERNLKRWAKIRKSRTSGKD